MIQKIVARFFKNTTRLAALACMVSVLAMAMPVQAADPPADITAQTWAVADAGTGQILADHGGDIQMNPASITKVLTVALALEKAGGDFTVPLTVSQTAVDAITYDSSHIALIPGEQVTLADMAYGAMLASGNDAANVLAEYVCGSLDAVEEVYTAKLEQLGCTGTHFVNAHGLYDPQHYTTAKDMAAILCWALTVPGFETVFNSMEYTMQPTNLQPEARPFSTADWLRLHGIKYHYDPARGSKNGWTTESGHTFVALAEKDGRRLVCVLLNCQTKYTKFVDAAKLFEYGFNEFSPVTITSEQVQLASVPVYDGATQVTQIQLDFEPVTLLLKNGLTAADVVATPLDADRYVMGKPFTPSVRLSLRQGVSGQTADLGVYSLETPSLEVILQAASSFAAAPPDSQAVRNADRHDPIRWTAVLALAAGIAAAACVVWVRRLQLRRRLAGGRVSRTQGLSYTRGPVLWRMPGQKASRAGGPPVQRKHKRY